MKSPYTSSLAHTTWECKYHIVCALKIRRQEIYGKIKQDIGAILRELAKRKDVEILATETFLCREYYVSTVKNNKEAVHKYMENQLKENIAADNNKRI